MDIILNAGGIVTTVFLMIALGMGLTAIGWINEQNGDLLAKLVVKVSLPCTILNTMLTRYDKATFIENIPGLLVSFLATGVLIPIGFAAARLFRVPKERHGVFLSMFAFSNTIFIGLPISQTLFGEDAIPIALLFYAANTTLFWVVGYQLMYQDVQGAHGKMPLRQRVLRLFPLPLVVFLLSTAMILLGITLPSFLLRTAGYVGNLVTPLSLMYTGYVGMKMIKRGVVRWQRGYAAVVVTRFVLAPLMILVSAKFFPISVPVRDVLLIQSAMPVMTQVSIIAGTMGTDEEYAAGGMALTTALMLFFIPLYMVLIG